MSVIFTTEPDEARDVRGYDPDVVEGHMDRVDWRDDEIDELYNDGEFDRVVGRGPKDPRQIQRFREVAENGF